MIACPVQESRVFLAMAATTAVAVLMREDGLSMVR
jgi:hypothetical protein